MHNQTIVSCHYACTTCFFWTSLKKNASVSLPLLPSCCNSPEDFSTTKSGYQVREPQLSLPPAIYSHFGVFSLAGRGQFKDFLFVFFSCILFITQPFPCALSFRLTLPQHSSFTVGTKTSPDSAVPAKGTKPQGPIKSRVCPMPKPYLSCFWFRTAIESAYHSGYTSTRSAVFLACRVALHLPV